MSAYPLPARLDRLVLATLAAACLTAACGKKDAAADSAAATPPADTTAAATTPPPAPAAPAAPTDAQIAHVVVTANSIDSAAGAMAKSKGTAKAVKDFGQTMMTDHGGVNKQAVALATKLNLTPEDNDISKGLKTGADQSSTALQAATGAAFDSAYIAHEVDYHQAVLDALDKTLIPNAQNADLKALLEKTRPAVAAHLERAKSVQAGLGKK